MEPEHGVNNQENQVDYLNRWYEETVLKISVQIEPLELRREFSGLVGSYNKAKRQCKELLNEKSESEEELLQSRVEQEVLRQEIAKLKEDFGAVQRQNADLQHQITNLKLLHEHIAVRTREEAQIVVPKKRRRVQEDEDLDDPPYKQTKSDGFSREQIRDVLGGSDRGWGSTRERSRPGIQYMYHVFLNVGACLFGVSPSRKQDVSEAVFGFGLTDNVILSRNVVFPLFVRGVDGHRSHFTYLGNYAAVELHPVAWERLSEEAKDCTVRTVLSKGLSAVCSLRKLQKGMEHNLIHHQFREGTFKVPCSRLEFQSFDEELANEIQNSPGRRSGR